MSNKEEKEIKDAKRSLEAIKGFLLLGARVILTVIVTPLVLWAGSTLIQHEKEIASFKTHLEYIQKRDKEFAEKFNKTDLKLNEMYKEILGKNPPK